MSKLVLALLFAGACSHENAAPLPAMFDGAVVDSAATVDGPSTDAPATAQTDCFGVEMLYPTKPGGATWCVNMTDPPSDPRFRNLPAMTLQPDGSWQVHGRSSNGYQVRMEAWSEPGKPWLNVEITEYAKVVSVGSSGRVLQMYSRGGHHSSNTPCAGSAYKSRLWFDRTATWVKEICHPAYTSNRGRETVTTTPIVGRWIGHKAVIYNVTEGNQTFVRMESYLDDDAQDAAGNLIIANDWKLMSTVDDRGGWTSSSYSSSCGSCAYDNGEVMLGPGGIAGENIAAWRSDDTRWNWKYLSVREIEPPAP